MQLDRVVSVPERCNPEAGHLRSVFADLPDLLQGVPCGSSNRRPLLHLTAVLPAGPLPLPIHAQLAAEVLLCMDAR